MVCWRDGSCTESVELDLTECEFVVRYFRLEPGVVAHGRIRYVTTGTRNQKAETVVLVPSWYTGTIEDNLYLVAAKAGIDPAKYFVVFTELFGSGKSSSPNNTPAPFAGPRFWVTSIRDNFRICHQLLFGKLKVSRLRSSRVSSRPGRSKSSFRSGDADDLICCVGAHCLRVMVDVHLLCN